MSRRVLTPVVPLLPVVLLLLVPWDLAESPQVGRRGATQTGNLHVRITYTDDRAATIHSRVQLAAMGTSQPIAEGISNDQGMVDFNGVPVGNYHLLVSGDGIEDTDSGMFEVDSRKVAQYYFVAVRRLREAEASKGDPKAGMIAAADLNLPKEAIKEFDKASEEMAKQNWKKAIERLDKAIAIYPQYAAAYNNLGVVYSRLGDRIHEREALQKAISLNDHFAPALVNLARMSMADRNYPDAETLLNKAIAIDPTNAQTLTLMAQVQLMAKHYADAIATVRKVHALPHHETYAAVHYIAARAFEHQNRALDAMAELETFLKEEPEGERALLVRKELASLQAQLR